MKMLSVIMILSLSLGIFAAQMPAGGVGRVLAVSELIRPPGSSPHFNVSVRVPETYFGLCTTGAGQGNFTDRSIVSYYAPKSYARDYACTVLVFTAGQLYSANPKKRLDLSETFFVRNEDARRGASIVSGIQHGPLKIDSDEDVTFYKKDNPRDFSQYGAFYPTDGWFYTVTARCQPDNADKFDQSRVNAICTDEFIKMGIKKISTGKTDLSTFALVDPENPEYKLPPVCENGGPCF